MPAQLPEDRQKVVLAIVSLGAFMATLDTSIVNIALPAIATAFDTDMGTVSWIVMAYLIVITGLMLACGRLGDIRGFSRVFIAGFALFTAGSLLCGLAPSIGFLVGFRVLQGIGGAAIGAMAPAMIAASFPEDRRGWALGILMTVVSGAIAAGPVLGGLLTGFLGWQWVFFVNVPIGIAALALALRMLPPDMPASGPGPFDLTGAAILLPALAALLFPLNQGMYLGWGSPIVTGSLAVSALLFMAFIVHERRCAVPLIDLSFFSSPGFSLGNLTGMLVVLVFAGSEFLLPFFLELVRGFPAELVGLLLAVPAVALMLAGPAAGRISDRSGPRGLMASAAILSAVTMFLFSRMDGTTGTGSIIATLAIEGAAVGLFMPPNMSLIMGSAGSRAGGAASGVMMTLRNGGAVLGVALLGTLAAGGTAGSWSGPDPSAAMLLPGFHAAWLAGAALCLAVAVISLSVPGGPAVPAPAG